MREVVVVGAGIAGLALALELRGHGIGVTVVEARWPGAGNSGRNVGRIRRLQLTADLTEISCRAADKWEHVARLTGGRNPLVYPTRYVLALYSADERAVIEPLQPMWDELGARARLMEPEDVLRAVPILRGGEPLVGGVIGAAAIVHHDAAVYAYLLAARDAGVRFETGVGAAGIEIAGGAVTALRLDDERLLPADAVVNAAGGRSGEFARACGLDVPNAPVRREVLVTEPSRPFMTPAVTFYRPQEGWFNQTLRGELVAGVVDVDEPVAMTEESTFRFLARTARIVLEKAPRLGELRVIRQWAGVYDTSPDKRPMVGRYAGVEGMYALNGWSGRGMLLAPLCADLLARELAGLGRDRLLATFDPGRFTGAELVSGAPADYYGGYAH
jgi:sarcosine oxidase subunit beta